MNPAVLSMSIRHSIRHTGPDVGPDDRSIGLKFVLLLCTVLYCATLTGRNGRFNKLPKYPPISIKINVKTIYCKMIKYSFKLSFSFKC